MPGRHLPAAPVPEEGPARAVSSRLDYPLLALGVVAVSFSAVLIRWANAPGLSVALWRDAIAAALVVPLAIVRHRDELLSPSGSRRSRAPARADWKAGRDRGWRD